MDFEDSVKRLARDQSKMRGNVRRDKRVVSEKAKRQAEYQRKQAARLREERERKKRLEEYQKQYMHKCDRSVLVKPIGNFNPTSIFGEGDKIALPPSVLESLTSSSADNIGNPWTFRIGILNPDYQFPSSPLIQTLKPPKEEDEYDIMVHDSDDDDDEDDDYMAAYRDEISRRFLSVTYCTVVEFTQDEGHVGIPLPIAKALLEPNNISSSSSNLNKLPVKRTVDPAGQSEEEEKSLTDQTPGHLAWGAFDIPDMPLEISLVRLPKGKGCTLVPTRQAIQNNFYGLKDVKLVLEQSLIRTRATLSVGDTISTWHRGVQFDLRVTKVIPSSSNAVTCINTDIEVDIGEPEKSEEEHMQEQQRQQSAPSKPAETGHTLGGGQTPAAASTAGRTPMTTNTEAVEPSPMSVDLLPEPPEEQKEGVCTILIQHSGGRGKRRFAVEAAKIKDLFYFAFSLVGTKDIQLVTRFPRRVFKSQESQSKTLAEGGIQQGQEQFMVEFL